MPKTLSPRGLLFVFEGIDGAGKTTQARSLAKSLRDMGYTVTESKEPTNGKWGQELRRSAEHGRMPPQDELDLFIKDRREHVRELLEPALAAGHVVIIDRYYFSTAAYQGARGMDFVDILRLNEDFAPQPDILFLLQVPPQVGRARIAERGDRANHFEGEAALAASAEIFDRIERPYLRKLDGTRPIRELQHVIEYAANQLIDDIERPIQPNPAGVKNLVDEANKLIDDPSIPDGDKPQALLDRLGFASKPL